MHVVFDEYNPFDPSKGCVDDDDVGIEREIQELFLEEP